MLAARLWGKKYGGPGCKITLGTDPQVYENAIALGATHIQKSSVEAVADEENMIISTPGYLNQNATPFNVFCGIERLLAEVPSLTKKESAKSSGMRADILNQLKVGLSKQELERMEKEEEERLKKPKIK